MRPEAIATLGDNRYRLLKPIGQGTFSRTYRAVEIESEQRVIIKTLAKNLVNHGDFEQFKQQFLNLARQLRAIKEKHLVPVRDIFCHHQKPYIVYDYLPGPNLKQLIDKKGPLKEKKALGYIRQVSKALAALHHQHLYHLDLKPNNIIRHQGRGRVVLADFGLTSNLSPALRQTHANLLLTGYAPIEQYLWEGEITPASEVYALAALLHFLLTGHSPAPAPLRTNQTVPPELRSPLLSQPEQSISTTTQEAILQGLLIDREERPPSITAWLELLPEPVTAQKVPQQPQENSQVPTDTLKVVSSPTETPSPPPESSESKPKQNSVRFQKKSQEGKKVKVAQIVSPKRFPVGALALTSVLAASAGVGFGLAVRLNRPDEPGSSIFHQEQSFPERTDWQIHEDTSN